MWLLPIVGSLILTSLYYFINSPYNRHLQFFLQAFVGYFGTFHLKPVFYALLIVFQGSQRLAACPAPLISRIHSNFLSFA